MPVTGNVTTFCTNGVLTTDTTTFDLGSMTDPNTGSLKNSIATFTKTLNGAVCNAASTINVAAQPMTAQSFTSTPPAGFSRSVDYTATASGWTPTPAVYVTSQPQNAAATQSRNAPFSGQIALTLSGFATTGGQTLKLVSDPNYSGADRRHRHGGELSMTRKTLFACRWPSPPRSLRPRRTRNRRPRCRHRRSRSPARRPRSAPSSARRSPTRTWSMSTASTAPTLKISQLTDATTLTTLPASAQISFDAVCTYAHTITIQSQNNGLWRDGSTQPLQNGFADAVPWTGRLQWGSLNRTFVAGAQNRQIVEFPFAVAGANTGQLLLTFSIQAGSTNSVANGPLLAGNYQDTIYVTVEPQ